MFKWAGRTANMSARALAVLVPVAIIMSVMTAVIPVLRVAVVLIAPAIVIPVMVMMVITAGGRQESGDQGELRKASQHCCFLDPQRGFLVARL